MSTPGPSTKATATQDQQHRGRIHLAKVTAPQPPQNVITRHKIIKEVTDSAESVIALIAPSGFGKTTLMSQLYKRTPPESGAKGWLSLDDRDNDFSRFVFYIREVIVGMNIFSWAPTLPTENVRTRIFPEIHAEAFELIDVIASTPKPFTLFLDKFEIIASKKVASFVNDLIKSLNPNQKIFIGSQTLTTLSVPSLIVKGRLKKVCTETLRFNLQETRTYFEMHTSLSLTEDEIKALKNKTEGWPAALRLAALALERAENPSSWIEDLSGQTKGIAQYLADNVLVQLPKELSAFMLETSILGQLDPALCDAVRESTDSAAHLRDIATAEIFLREVKPESICYEFHSLFRSFLLTELHRNYPWKIARLHRNASVFLRQNGRYSDAIDHAIKSGDKELAAQTLDQYALKFVELGQLDSIARWVELVGSAEIINRPNIQKARAYCMISMHRYEEAQDALQEIQRISSGAGQPQDAETSMQLALMYEWMDRHDLAAPVVAQMAPNIFPDNQLAFVISRNIMSYLAMLSADYPAAQEGLNSAKSVYDALGQSSWPNCYTACFEGVLEMTQGNVRSAVQLFESSWTSTPQTCRSVPSAYFADALYLQGDLVRAESFISKHLRQNKLVVPPDVVILTYRTAARIAFNNGDLDKTEILLSELCDIGNIRNLYRLKAVAWLEKSRLALLCGDGTLATRYLKQGSADTIWNQHAGALFYPQELDDVFIAEIRIQLVLGDPRKSLPLIKKEIQKCIQQGRRLRKLRLQCMLAQAHFKIRKKKSALQLFTETINELLHITIGKGLIYLLADEPWYLLDLLQALSEQKTTLDSEFLDSLITACRSVNRLSGELLILEEPNILTAKESSVISQVAAGLSNKEIARILDITENTVETHLRRIYQKLDTKNRTQAVTKAQESGLLH